jgi:ribosomal protein L29
MGMLPTRVADMTVDDLQDLLRGTLRELVEEIIEEKVGLLRDPDEGLELREEVAQSLRDYLSTERRGDDADEVFRSLGLD